MLPPQIPRPGRLSQKSKVGVTKMMVVESTSLSSIASTPAPNMPRPSEQERSTSTTIRLQRQGFRESERIGGNFAVRSIRRGSDSWNEVLRLFVSDLAFRSIIHRRFQSEISFRPYTCQAAVLFVDLSHYSRIAAAVSHRGAHALSTMVNDYLESLLSLVHLLGGDVVKFAGDAVLIVWEGEAKDLEMNVIAAARCVLEMQEQAGSYPVEGTDLVFRIHCGLCCGLLESEVFDAPVHEHMQRLYHSVSGECLVEMSEIVDMARAGEVCVSERVVELIGTRGIFCDVPAASGCQLLTALDLDDASLESLEKHLKQLTSIRLESRNKGVEEGFIHPKVIRLLCHGGRSPTQISQIRNLCVLFIAMTSNGSSVNWLMEVQTILDKNRCPSKLNSTFAGFAIR